MKLWQRWKQTTVANQAMVATSVLIAFGTLFYAGAAVVQLCMIRESGRHTDEQIGYIIGNINWLARSMDENKTEIIENDKQIAVRTQQALDSARDQFTIAQRPWIAVFEPKITKFYWDEIPSGPNNQKMGSLFWQNQVSVKNFGNLPATNVQLIYDPNPVLSDSAVAPKNWWKAVMKEQDKYCASQVSEHVFANTFRSVTVFPQQPFDFDVTDDPPIEKPVSEWPSRVHLYIRGCVKYRSPSDTKWHQTGFFYILRRKLYGQQFSPWPLYKEPLVNIFLLDQSGETNSN